MMEMTRRKLLKVLSNVPFVLFGLHGIKVSQDKPSHEAFPKYGKRWFWFEYVKHPAWGGGYWQLFKAPNEQIPILVGLYPLRPLAYPSFKGRMPAPGEIGAYVAYRNTLSISSDDWVEFAQLLRQSSLEDQFRAELVPGARLEIYDGTSLCAEMESILGRTKILA